jgi:putative transposase
LRHPDLPRAALSPNEMYAALVAVAGHVPLALSGTDYLELLPVAWRRITAEGIRLGYLSYDSAALNGHRGQSSGIAARSGRWEVRYDPYDLGQVWVRADSPTGWVAVPWIHYQQTRAPFADFTVRHIRRVLAGRGQDTATQADIARALDDLLTRAGTGPTSPDQAARRVAARTAAGAARRRRPDLPTPDAADYAEHRSSGRDPAVSEPLGLVDPYADVERVW